MAENKRAQKDGQEASASRGTEVGRTEYVVDSDPDLPDANVTVSRDEPVIDKRLVEARDAEAKRNADRVR